MPLAKIAWSGQKQGLRGPGRGVENRQLPHQSMIPKSGSRFSEKITLKQKDKRRVWFNAVETDSSATVQQDSPS
jgi:hypothetical protein